MKALKIKDNVRLDVLRKNSKYHLEKGNDSYPIIIWNQTRMIEAASGWVSSDEYYTDEVGLFELIKENKVEVVRKFRGLSPDDVKKIMDEHCLKSIGDTVELKALTEYLNENVYDKDMGIRSVEAIPLNKQIIFWKSGQAFRINTFYDSAFGADRGCLFPQDMPYIEIIVGGVKQDD